jgi:P27 family predicted phage terminase small subunit
MAGRPAKPTRLKLLQGNPGKRTLPHNEPQPELGVPTRPGWLAPEAKREWNRVVPELRRLGLLARIDRAMLVMWCETWGIFVEADRDIHENGSTFKTETGYVGPRPEVGIRFKAIEKLSQLSARFGMSPSDRAKMSAPPIEEENEFAKFLKGQAVNE